MVFIRVIYHQAQEAQRRSAGNRDMTGFLLSEATYKVTKAAVILQSEESNAESNEESESHPTPKPSARVRNSNY